MDQYRTSTLAGIDEGLAARVADPLWLLARQWQFGEFAAEFELGRHTEQFAASAVALEVELEVHRLDRWRPSSEKAWRRFDVNAEPFERIVEEEPPTLDPRLRLEGGLHFQELLGEARLDHLVDRFIACCPFKAARPSETERDRLADAVRARVADGARLAQTLQGLVAGSREPLAALALDDRELETTSEIARHWLEWWEPRAGTMDAGTPEHPVAWDEHRLEYAFETRASTLGNTRLVANRHSAGPLDWWAADAASGVGVDDTSRAERITHKGVPMSPRFGGMPVPRFWEMEDARFDAGAVEAGPMDLGRLLFLTFATVYSNDWFVLPVRLPVASLTKVTRLTITDVFGRTRNLPRAGADDDGWNLFALTDASAAKRPGGEHATSPWFYLPATLPQSLESEPVESVVLLRDELANLGWGVESLVTDDAGERVSRAEQWAARPKSEPEPGVFYRARSDVPDHWYPFAPHRISSDASVVLWMLSLLAPAERVARPPPRGALLASAGTPDAWIHEEEVPRSGVEIVRTRQHARWHDGSSHAWTGRRKRAGRGEGSSGLRFDFVEERRGQ